MPNKDEFYFAFLEAQRLRGINERIAELNQQASDLCNRCLRPCNRKQSREVADSLSSVARSLKSLQKRRHEMLVSGRNPNPTKFVRDFGRRCEACVNLPLFQDDADKRWVLSASEACPPHPELDALLYLADAVEECLASGVNSRSGFQRVTVTGAISTLQSALLRQKGPLPRFRD